MHNTIKSIDPLQRNENTLCDYRGCDSLAEWVILLTLPDSGIIALNFCTNCLNEFQKPLIKSAYGNKCKISYDTGFKHFNAFNDFLSNYTNHNVDDAFYSKIDLNRWKSSRDNHRAVNNLHKSKVVFHD